MEYVTKGEMRGLGKVVWKGWLVVVVVVVV